MTEKPSQAPHRQSHVQRTSYRKHRERLADIRHNLTTKDFFLQAHPRPSDRKGMLRNQLKQQQILHYNELLHNKINCIKGRSQQEVEPALVSKTEQVRNHLIRYEQEEGRIEIKSDLSDGEPVRCIVPTRTRAVSFMQKIKPTARPEAKSYFSSKPEKTYKTRPHPQSFHRSHNSQRSDPKSIPNELYFNLPERNEQRSVVHHKTMLVSSSQSCLYELSLIGDRLLIAAHLMGKEKYCITELLPEKKSKQIMREYQNNFEDFYQKISLQEISGKYHSVKINLDKGERETKEQKSSEEKVKEKVKDKIKMQNQFIKRNYYQTLKKEEDNHSEGSKNKPTITHEKLEELVQRLTAPKRYFLKDQAYIPPLPPNGQSHSKTSIQVEKKGIVEGSKEYGTEKRIKKQDNGGQRPKSKEEYLFKKTDSLTIEQLNKDGRASPQKESSGILSSQIINKSGLVAKEEVEEDVEYLQGDEQNQEQQFQDPSALNQSNLVKDPLSHSSQLHRAGRQKGKDPKTDPKVDSINENEYQHQDYEQVFEESSPKAKKTSIKNNSSVVPEEKVEEEYGDEQFEP